MNEIFQHIFPGLMIMWVFFNAQNLMADIYTEKDKKTLFRLAASTITINQFVYSKIIRVFVVCTLSQILLIIATWFLFGMNWGNLLWIAVILSATTLSITGIIAFIYAYSPSLHTANAIIQLVIIFSSMFGGSLMPYEELPELMQMIGSFSVNRQGIVGIHTIMYERNINIMLKPALILTVVGVLTTCLSSLRLQQRIASGKML